MVREYQTSEALRRELIYALYQHKGRANAIDRWSLVRRIFGEEAVTSKAEETDSNTYDRRLRDEIEILRKPPFSHFVCNMGDGSGYFIAHDREEYERWKKYYLGPTYEKWIVVNAMDPIADARWGKTPKDPDPLPLFEGVQV